MQFKPLRAPGFKPLRAPGPHSQNSWSSFFGYEVYSRYLTRALKQETNARNSPSRGP